MARDSKQEEAIIPVNADRSAASATHDQTTAQQGSPRPLGEAMVRLPRRYFKAVAKPSLKTFAEESGKASWGIVWVQLLIWAIFDGLLGLLVNVISPPASNTFLGIKGVSTTALQILTWGSSIGLIAVVPILFFLIMGIMYVLAKAFGGTGTLLDQSNASLYLQVPLGLGSKLLALIPSFGRILNSVLSLYGIVLQVVVIMAVHHLNWMKATGILILSLVLALIPVAAVLGGVILLVH